MTVIGNPRNSTQGRCHKCNVAYRWKGRPRLWDARCPTCGRKLWRTTYFLKSAPWILAKPDTQKPAKPAQAVPLPNLGIF